MARAAAATAIFKRELDGLDGKNVSRQLDDTSKSVDKVGTSSRRTGPDIDKLSGRLRLLTDAAVTLGPALIPLSAGALPALTGGIAGLGAAAGGLGVSILAFQGLKDALKALNDYQLEPTAQNLQALRIEQEKLGVSGTKFLRYIDSLEPTLRDLQTTARDGIFPGVEDGIDDLLTRLPQVRNIVANLSDEMGVLARDAGAALGGDEWTAFFDYVESDAGPTLDAFGRSAGNVALGLANMLAAFAPASRDFTGGLLDATRAFADWSSTLDDNQSFQDFLSYIRQSGPEAVDFLVAITKALTSLLQAAAPFGAVVLPALTQVANIFADIAGSPIGPALYTAAAALIAFNRASLIAEKGSTKLKASLDGIGRARVGQGIAGGLGLLALQATDLDEKVGLANTSMDAMAGLMVGGPWGAAVGAAIGQYQDLNAATSTWTENIRRANDALMSGDTQQISDELANLQEQYAKLQESVPKSDLGKAALFLNPSKLISTNEAMKAYADAISELDGAQKEGGDVADLFAESVGRTGAAMRIAAGDATALSSALAALNGWFDKRDAVRAYKDALDGVTAGLKDGFSRDDAANIDAVGRSILQVANNIKNPAAQQNFLTNARAQLEAMAKTSGPAASRAIQQVIDKFDSKGLTNPPKLKIDADSKLAESKIKRVKGQFDILGRSTTKPTVSGNDNPWQAIYGKTKKSLSGLDAFTATPRVTADTSAAQSAISSVRSLLLGLNGTTATTYVRSIRVAERAGGGIVNGPGTETSDSIPALLSNNEYVVRAAAVRKYGVGMFDTMNALRYASGGSVPGGGGFQEGNGTFHDGDVTNAAQGASGALKVLELRLKRVEAAAARQEKALDRQTAKLDSLTSAQSSLASSTSSSLIHDAFGNGLSGLQAQGDADTADANNMLAALKTLVAKGLSPDSALFQQLAASGDVNTAQQLAALDTQGVAVEQARFQGTQTSTTAVGQYAGQQTYGPDIKLQTKAVNEQRDATKELRQEVKHLQTQISQMKKHVKDGAKEGAKEGTREGHQDKDRTTHQQRRTGAR